MSVIKSILIYCVLFFIIFKVFFQWYKEKHINFISIIDWWNSLSLYKYMSWTGGCRTPMTIWIPIRASISSGLVGYQFLFGVATMCFRAYSFVWVAISIDNASGNKRLKIYIFSFVILHNSRWSRQFSDLNRSKRVTPFSNVGENSINIAVNFLFVRRSHLGKFDVEVKIIQHIYIAEYIFPLLPQYCWDWSLETLHFHDHHHSNFHHCLQIFMNETRVVKSM